MVLVLSIVCILVSFYFIAIVSDEFFVPAIDKIAHKLKLSSDAAGATLLAIGSSAPEFFTSFVAIMGLVSSDHADVGAGTIVGSAIFNILVIVGIVALFRAVQLQWKPVMRDIGFYILTIIALLVAFSDGQIVLYEALGFLVLYGVYIYAVVNWRKWFHYNEPPEPEQPDFKNSKGLHKVAHSITSLLVPDPNKTKRPALTFIMSIILIAGLSWVLVDRVIVIADILSINATFLALSVLAAGTSIPDLIGSVIVAKQGRGDMAVSNAVGSNIFDVLFCLGFPWALYLVINPGSIAVSNANLASSILLLFATVVAILFLLLIRNWRIGHKSGLFLIALYIAYCVYIAITVA